MRKSEVVKEEIDESAVDVVTPRRLKDEEVRENEAAIACRTIATIEAGCDGVERINDAILNQGLEGDGDVYDAKVDGECTYSVAHAAVWGAVNPGANAEWMKIAQNSIETPTVSVTCGEGADTVPGGDGFGCSAEKAQPNRSD